MRIEGLNDYPALKKLAAALWQEDSAYHGAAVMVGAGFSRSAASTGSPDDKMPIWRDLSNILSKDLGSDGTDQLRLAEEYSAYFGRQSLLDTLKKTLNDAAWMPGEMFGALLELPWSEVMTTNWDTLLERASGNVTQRAYSVVTRQEELSSTHSPRIVKLHGTVGVTEDLVFTQEDFRRYPQQHAAFVNFARHVFIENELCLLGFSGDDPNFLQWAGWVRDHLASHARRIYLVGALGLTSARRKYLESINIAPIDLAGLVTDYDSLDARHREATKAFLSALANLKPKQAWEWMPTELHRSTVSADEIQKTQTDHSYGAGLLERQLPALVEDRLSFPGWLVCPWRQRWGLQTQVHDPYPTPDNLEALSVKVRARILYELAWRYEVTFAVVPTWLAVLMLDVCDSETQNTLSKEEQARVGLILLRNCRWLTGSGVESIRARSEELLRRNAKHWPDANNEILYFLAISARDSFDYASMEAIAADISTVDPIWKLKKSSLLSEVGRFDEGRRLIAEAYKELLDRYRKSRGSIYFLSRLSWAHWMLRAADMLQPGKGIIDLPSYYRDAKCSPYDYVDQVRSDIEEALEKHEKAKLIEPLFAPGSYRDNSSTVTFNNQIHPLLVLEGMCDAVGIPVRWENVNLLANEASKLALLDGIEDAHRFSLAIRAASSDTCDSVKSVFSRGNVAVLERAVVDRMISDCVKAIEYWGDRIRTAGTEDRTYVIGRLRVFMEVLARMSVRATTIQAKSIFRLGIALGKRGEFRHFWLFDALGHMIDYALKSIPENEQGDLLLDALSFPLGREWALDDNFGWPNPVIKHLGVRGESGALDRRIEEIINLVHPCSRKSAPALSRLLPMMKSGFLREEERGRLAKQIWGDYQNYETIPNTGLLSSLLLDLPAEDSGRATNLIRKYLFEPEASSLFISSFLRDMVYAARWMATPIFPSEDQASDLFDRLVAWRPEERAGDGFGFSSRDDQELVELVGRTISESVTPAMAVAAKNEEQFERLLSFHNAVPNAPIGIALAYFAAADDSFSSRVEKLIGRLLQSRNSDEVGNGAFAVLRWMELMRSPSAERSVQKLVQIISTGRHVGLSALLWTANELFSKGFISNGDVDSLIDAIPSIFDASDYKNISPYSAESVTASFIRAACHALSRAILSASAEKDAELLRVVAEASEDALPEVRFA